MPAPKSPAFAAAYIRVSTDDQAELSPESQLVEIQKYARREGIVLLSDHIYVDAGISGKKADRRPEFQRMIADSQIQSPLLHPPCLEVQPLRPEPGGKHFL